MTKKSKQKSDFCRKYRESAGSGGTFTLRDTDITVNQILCELDAYGEEGILKRHVKLTSKDILTCQTVAAVNIPGRKEYKSNGHEGAPKILLDENLSQNIIPKVLNDESRFSHVNFARLTSNSDPIIWRFAKEKGFGIVLTNDTDFIHIAEMEALHRLYKTKSFNAADITSIPYVIHVHTDAKDSKKIGHFINGNLSDILLDSSPSSKTLIYGYLDQNGYKSGPDIRQLYYKYLRESLKASARTYNDLAPVLKAPVFDEKIIDYRTINDLCQKAGFQQLSFTKISCWRDFYNEIHQNGPLSNPQTCSSSQRVLCRSL